MRKFRITIVLIFVLFFLVAVGAFIFGIIKSKTQSNLISLVNQNSKIAVSIASDAKLKAALAQFPKISQSASEDLLTIIITDRDLISGQVDFWSLTNEKQIAFGGFDTNFEGKNKVVTLAVKVDVVKNYGWNEDKIAQYLEGNLYSALINVQKQTKVNDLTGEARDFNSQMSRSFSGNLFKVGYVIND